MSSGRRSAYDRVVSRALEDASTRLLALVTGVLGVALAAVLPTLFTAAADAPSAGVAVLTLALAALLAVATRQVLLAACLRPIATVAASGPPPLLPGRVTDPVHHPLRPRAPGLA
jgi:hypothetical protein